MAPHVGTSCGHDLESMLVDGEPKALPLSLLQHITCGFSADQEIGRGGFAVVYKGTLANGLTVAVKKMLSHCYMHEKEFHREVACLLKVNHHPNIVKFLGYCSDTQGSMEIFNGKAVMAEVQQRLLCFEFLPKRSLDKHIQDASCGLEWSKRYKIIKGICEGLSYLHGNNIMHLDLKPPNILLDANMIPKISDFGLSRIFEEDESRFVASEVSGTFGYVAPEFSSKEITHKLDLYSLGVLLLEILTGKRGYQAVETVLESWSNRLDKSQANTSFVQIRVCAEIALECIDHNPENRPDSIHHIVVRLNETEISQVNQCSSELLDIQPLVLRFPFEPNKIVWCSLQLTNNTNEHVSFRLTNSNGNKLCFLMLPLLGIVPPRSAYTLLVGTKEQEKLPEHKYFDLILESIILGVEHAYLSKTYKRDGSKTYKSDGFFEKTKQMGHAVHEVTLKAVCTPQPGVTMSKVLQVPFRYGDFSSLDMHPTKQWIITGESCGYIHIWNYETQKLVGSYKVSQKEDSIKFIEQKKWFVAGTKDGYIHVYSYDKMKKIRSFRANTDGKTVEALAVHPTQSYILSVSDGGEEAKFWDWNRGWECTQTFRTENPYQPRFVFNPMDITIASASKHTIKIWGPDSAEPKYTLSGHSKYVNCLEFFKSTDQQYLITGSDDCTVKIWDVEKRMCVHTLEAFMSQVKSVFFSPNLAILITTSCDETLYFWSSTDFRLEKVLQIGLTGYSNRLSCLIDPRRVLIKHGYHKSVMFIGAVGYESGSTDSCVQQLNADSVSRNTISEDCVSAWEKSMEVDCVSEVNPVSSRLLDVRPMSGSLELVNNTDEHVAFKFMRNGGILPAKSTYTLILERTNHNAILESSISGNRNNMPFANQSECDEFFEDAREMGKAVYELALEDILARQGENLLPASCMPRGFRSGTGIPPTLGAYTLMFPFHLSRLSAAGGLYMHGATTWQAISSITKIFLDADTGHFHGLYVHPTDLLMLTVHQLIGHRTEFWLFNYDTQAKKILRIDSAILPCFVKFVAQKQLFVTGTPDGLIHVYNYGEDIQEIISFRVDDYCDIKLAHYSTESYVSSLSAGLIKLWGWNKCSPDLIKENDWKCTQTFEAIQSGLEWRTVFNRKDMNCFAAASDDYTIKVSYLDSPGSNYTLCGHSDIVNCLEFFRRNDRDYLITGSDDCTAKIWDLQRKTCVHTLRSFMSPVISVISLVDLPYLILSSEDGIIHIWNSRNSRLERMVSFGNVGQIPHLYLMGKRRVVIVRSGGQYGKILSFMDIDNQGSAVNSLHLE